MRKWVLSILFLAEIFLNKHTRGVDQLTEEGAAFVQKSATDTRSEFLELEKVYKTPELNKGFYKKWTPDGEKVSRDARLLEMALRKFNEDTEELVRDEGGGDYALGDYNVALRNDMRNLSQRDRIRLLLKQFSKINDKERVGSDYSGAAVDTEKDEIGSSCDLTSSSCDFHSRYREINGECNNVNIPNRGKANTALKRLFPEDILYEDGIGAPRLTTKLKDGTRMLLPNARFISKRVHQNKEQESIKQSTVTHILMQFGQFLDHDITLTAEPELECCSEELVNNSRCFNIRMDYNTLVDMSTDPIHLNAYPNKVQKCISLSRSDPACGTGLSSDGKSIREQINSLTGFIDSSNVYGNHEKIARALRRRKDRETWKFPGLLEVNKGNFKDLPTRKQVKLDDEFNPEEKSFMIAGDMRCVEHPGLLSMHSLWMNEHNRIATKLWGYKTLRDHMKEVFGKDSIKKDEFIYQETRRIISAEMQKVTYGDFLPLVVGPDLMNEYDLNIDKPSTYDPEVDPTILNEFATVSFRFGHTLVSSFFSRIKSRTSKVKNINKGIFLLQNVFFNENESKCVNSTCETDKNIAHSDLCTNTTCKDWTEDVLYGLVHMPADNDDLFLNNDLIDSLFLSKELHDQIHSTRKKSAESSDLAARNIQRGRDHGLPGYNIFRTKIPGSKLKDLNSFGLSHCEDCMQLTEDNDIFCNPMLIPDRECENCLNFENFVELAKASQDPANSPKCNRCLKRKCGESCVPIAKVENLTSCATCFQEQIVALHSCDDIYKKNPLVRSKCACKECMDANAGKARKLNEDDLAIKIEDFIRISEPYCWHLDSIDPFTGCLAEISVKGGLQGPTNARLMAIQFHNLKKGDRYFFTHKFSRDSEEERGLEYQIRNYVSKQSLATILCNNLKSYRMWGKKKSWMKMKENPFLLDSRWEQCSGIIRKSDVGFRHIPRDILRGLGTKNLLKECSTSEECKKKYKSSDYNCIKKQCFYMQVTCYTTEDCEDKKICKEGICVPDLDPKCVAANCTNRWEICRVVKYNTICTCLYSNLIPPDCPRRP